MRLFIGAKVVLKTGEVVRITAIPDADYVYGRIIPSDTFVIVRYSDITAIYHPKQRRLFV